MTISFRSLVTIAALPGQRANTKLEREVNAPPVQRNIVLDVTTIYKDLKIGQPPVKKVAPVIKARVSVGSRFDKFVDEAIERKNAERQRLMKRSLLEQVYAERALSSSTISS